MLLQTRDVRDVAEILRVVQSVADKEFVRSIKTHKLHRMMQVVARRLAEERGAVLVGSARDGLDVDRIDEAARCVVDENDVRAGRDGAHAGAHHGIDGGGVGASRGACA